MQISMGQWVPDRGSDSELNESLSQSVFKFLIGRWVSLYSYFNSDSKCKFQLVSRFPIGVATVNSLTKKS